MQEGESTVARSIGFEQARLINEVCDRFEADWKAEVRPRIEDYLEGVREPVLTALFRELLALELALQWRGGDRLGPEEYRARFPAFLEEVEAAFESSSTLPASLIPDFPPAVGSPTSAGSRFRIVRPHARGGAG